MTGATQSNIARLLDLAGKAAIVTGAASGIGRATARYLADAGAFVAVADRDEAGAEKVAADLRATGAEAASIAVDIADEASVVRLMQQTRALFGRLDILINNAGIQNRAMLTETSVAFWDLNQAVNARGPFLCVREAAPIMRDNGGGAIVNVSSCGSVHPVMTGLTAYGASKAAVNALTRNAALELASAGIRVNAVLPGGVMTEGGAAASGTTPEGRAAALPPLGRLAAPEDIAGLILFLASPAASYITGQTFIADGGFLLG
jgi:NAD(P)-dependent dehydrogenase (short-subunit alcohol dehydrogenase family)